MSVIFSALRALDQELKEEADAVLSKLRCATSSVQPYEFAGTVEYIPPSRTETSDAADSARRITPEARFAADGEDEFNDLEERILTVTEMVRQEREKRAAAEERALIAESAVSAHALRIDELEQELGARLGEQQNRRERIRKMVAMLDSLSNDTDCDLPT